MCFLKRRGDFGSSLGMGLHTPDAPTPTPVHAQKPVCLGEKCQVAMWVGGPSFISGPKKPTLLPALAVHNSLQPRPCWRMKLPSHLASWKTITSQCLEQPMAKVTDPQIVHLVRHTGLALLFCLVV